MTASHSSTPPSRAQEGSEQTREQAASIAAELRDVLGTCMHTDCSMPKCATTARAVKFLESLASPEAPRSAKYETLGGDGYTGLVSASGLRISAVPRAEETPTQPCRSCEGTGSDTFDAQCTMCAGAGSFSATPEELRRAFEAGASLVFDHVNNECELPSEEYMVDAIAEYLDNTILARVPSPESAAEPPQAFTAEDVRLAYVEGAFQHGQHSDKTISRGADGYVAKLAGPSAAESEQPKHDDKDYAYCAYCGWHLSTLGVASLRADLEAARRQHSAAMFARNETVRAVTSDLEAARKALEEIREISLRAEQRRGRTVRYPRGCCSCPTSRQARDTSAAGLCVLRGPNGERAGDAMCRLWCNGRTSRGGEPRVIEHVLVWSVLLGIVAAELLIGIGMWRLHRAGRRWIRAKAEAVRLRRTQRLAECRCRTVPSVVGPRRLSLGCPVHDETA